MGVGRVGGMVSPLLIGVLLTLGPVGLSAGSGRFSDRCSSLAALPLLWLSHETCGRNRGPVLQAIPAPFRVALAVHSQIG
jgi:hypothetical protein